MRKLEICGINENKYVTLSKVFVLDSIPVGINNAPLQKDIDKGSYLKEMMLPHINEDMGLLIGNDRE